MRNRVSRVVIALVVAAVLGSAPAATAAVELNMYYPVAVGGPITKIIDGMIADFEKSTPASRSPPSTPATTTTPG